jgi:translocation and assembly module TamB
VVRSKLDISLEVARDAIYLNVLHFATSKTRLQVSGTVSHFANPQWKGSADGTVDLAEVSALGVVDGFQRGSANLALTGQGSGASQFVVDGNTRLANVTFSIPYVLIDGLNATTRLHVTPQEITLPDIVGRPRQGGIVNAALRLTNWQGRVPVMNIRARVRGVLLSTVLYSVVERGYQDLGFDTLGEGPVNVDWTGDASDLTVAAKLVMTTPDKTPPGELPISGTVDAKYFQRGGRVQINQLEAHSPATTLNVTGQRAFEPDHSPGQPQPRRV